jgi:lipoprotein-releasing system permease protein
MQARLNGMLGDLIFRTRSLDGAIDADAHMAKIREVAGDSIAGMSPTVHVPALMYLTVGGEVLPRQVTLVGIDEATYASVSEFGNYLQHPENRRQLNFNLRENGYDVIDHQVEDPSEAKPREVLGQAGWGYRRYKAMINKQRAELEKQAKAAEAAAGAPEKPQQPAAQDPFAALAAETGEPEGEDFDPATEQHAGIVLGIGICGYRMPDGTDHFLGLPGDDETGVGKFTTIQIKLKPGADADAVRDKIQDAFPAQFYQVSTWRDEQGPLLAAVQMETAVLNVLLFMIIAVAGFGIFAIFLMIVVEKTRDIGILKSLGASGWGVMSVFLAYGLSLGIVGAGVGTAMGLLFVANINEIADLLGRITGQPVFDPSVYYFYKIPTIVQPLTVTLIVVGSVLIAVGASVVPAIRAASLHPVKALRF